MHALECTRDERPQRRRRFGAGGLAEIAQARLTRANDRAALDLVEAGEQTYEGRLAGPVRTDEPDLHAVAEDAAEAREDRARAVMPLERVEA